MFLLLTLLAVPVAGYAIEREGRPGTRPERAGKTDPYPVRADDGTSEVRPETAESEEPGVFDRILPSRDTIWNFFVTAALVTVVAILWWVFFAASLKGACWFSLVEASLFRCAVLALFLTALSLVCFGTAAYFQGTGTGPWSPDLNGSLALLATGMVYLLSAVAVTKFILKCKWRSVITVWIMSTFVANAIVWSTYIGILATLPAEAAPIPVP